MRLSESSTQHALVPIEQGNPADDPRMFRRGLSQYGTGIAIVTTADGERRFAVTVNSFSSLSLDPPLLLWSIDRKSRSFPAFANCKHFAVNILSSEQIELSRHFSSKIDDKFADVVWHPGQSDSPLLDGCLAHFECDLHACHDGGDHLLLIGRVTRLTRFEGVPLIFSQGQYCIASEPPEVSGDSAEIANAGTGPSGNNLLQLIFDTHHALSEAFEEHRRAEGVSVAVARVLASVYASPGIKVGNVARQTYLGQRDAEDAIAWLAQKALLIRTADGGVRLTDAGLALRESIRTRWLAFEDAQLDGVSSADIAVLMRTLTRLVDRTRSQPDAVPATARLA